MTVSKNMSAEDQASQTAAAAGGVMLIACGALAREILTIKEQQGLAHLAVTCLPAKLHNRPQQIPEAVRAKIREARQNGYDQILVAYADCGTAGGLDKVLKEEGAERIGGPHCYAFFSGNKSFEARADEDFNCFFLTDFLVRHFDRLVIQGLGLDRHPELRDSYFGHYTRVVYLAQTKNAKLEEAAREAAGRLGLTYEYRFTGFGELTGFLTEGAMRAMPSWPS